MRTPYLDAIKESLYPDVGFDGLRVYWSILDALDAERPDKQSDGWFLHSIPAKRLPYKGAGIDIGLLTIEGYPQRAIDRLISATRDAWLSEYSGRTYR